MKIGAQSMKERAREWALELLGGRVVVEAWRLSRLPADMGPDSSAVGPDATLTLWRHEGIGAAGMVCEAVRDAWAEMRG